MTNFSVRINEGLKDRFSDYCGNIGMSMSEVIRKYIVDFLNGDAPSVTRDDYFIDVKGEKADETRLILRIDEELKLKFFEKCKNDNLPISFVIRVYIAKCVEKLG